jgi:hypothetical protein
MSALPNYYNQRVIILARLVTCWYKLVIVNNITIYPKLTSNQILQPSWPCPSKAFST